jgi:hypothetical protein
MPKKEKLEAREYGPGDQVKKFFWNKRDKIYESMWLNVLSVDQKNRVIHGELANHPIAAPNQYRGYKELKAWTKLTVKFDDLLGAYLKAGEVGEVPRKRKAAAPGRGKL